ncbi:hypothetical protein [Kaistia algarum]|nr:hypothetical protein [Kaistia algarum]MCX5514837.1 hypothetical protein [Kaistia algarum]
MASVMQDFDWSVKAVETGANCDRIMVNHSNFNQIAINPNDI